MLKPAFLKATNVQNLKLFFSVIDEVGWIRQLKSASPIRTIFAMWNITDNTFSYTHQCIKANSIG